MTFETLSSRRTISGFDGFALGPQPVYLKKNSRTEACVHLVDIVNVTLTVTVILSLSGSLVVEVAYNAMQILYQCIEWLERVVRFASPLFYTDSRHKFSI